MSVSRAVWASRQPWWPMVEPLVAQGGVVVQVHVKDLVIPDEYLDQALLAQGVRSVFIKNRRSGGLLSVCTCPAHRSWCAFVRPLSDYLGVEESGPERAAAWWAQSMSHSHDDAPN